MENCAIQLTDGELEEAIMLAASTSTTPNKTSSFFTALEECNLPSSDEVALGDHSSARLSMKQTSKYFSARVEEMMRSKSQFSSVVEYEIEHSRVHWSEVSGLSDLLEDDNDYEEVNRENEGVFTELMNDEQWKQCTWGDFFHEWKGELKLGQKIAEGGQAAIFEFLGTDGNVHPEMLLKVFKRGSRLSNLKKQWPSGILRQGVLCMAYGGTMLDDGRFAFLLKKCWGDLRKLIDQAMQEKNNQGPPFPCVWNGWTWHAKYFMLQIAYQMNELHKVGIIHRDLKAANILLHSSNNIFGIIVADFECSIGVVGTGFWRAPEILLALKNRSAIDFSEQVDVYSYGMICFEVVTGCLPFEGELEACRASNDLVIGGRRPKLPSDLDLSLKYLIERCWNPIPCERPSFLEIVKVLESLI